MNKERDREREREQEQEWFGTKELGVKEGRTRYINIILILLLLYCEVHREVTLFRNTEKERDREGDSEEQGM